MNDSLSEIDHQLVNGVLAGRSEDWEELVSQFHGRLLAFARRRLGQNADAEDAVQETFLSFMKSLKAFRGEARLETWLFQLLRRRIADAHRRAGRRQHVQLCLTDSQAADDDYHPSAKQAAASVDQSASWYVRQEEQQANDRAALLKAVSSSTDRLKADRRFQDLKTFDLLFFAHWRNQEIAQELGLEETAVAVLKHRFIQRVARQLGFNADRRDQSIQNPDLLTEVWRDGRPSCPKRTTLGKYILGTMPEDWDDFVTFHVERLGCEFCAANLEDLTTEINAPANETVDQLRGRILESTIGFLNPQVDRNPAK
ncbi:MAG: RNA polymerase sigma factor [Planctomycetota bacterium]|nr:RNA polymerase sigma factor [Planctomycetota bacterium]MDA0919675.1 RNA polymerase sigma factor [Planctomycetota bacterium]